MKILKSFLMILFISSVVLFSQSVEKQKNIDGKVNITTEHNNNISFKNSSNILLLEIADETDAGSIYIPSLSAIGNYNNKLYNLNNTLYWNNNPISSASQNSGWLLQNGKVYTSNPDYSVGIGTSSPLQKLHVESGIILVNGHINWFPGLTIKNDIGRSVLNLQGTTSSENYRSTQILLNDLTTNYNWSILTTDANELVLENSDATNYQQPFKIKYGAPTNSLTISENGNIGIGTWSNDYQLAVAGSIISEEIVVKLQSDWPDFVFTKNYTLPDLFDLEKYIAANNHLMGIPAEIEIKENGINVSEMQSKLLQKIEELTLYTIQQEKKIQNLSEQIELLKTQMSKDK